jgi:hypothetical protein
MRLKGGMMMWKWMQTKKDNCWLPYFMPSVWHTVLALVFSLGLIAGVWIAIETMRLRGLM